jgi:hypothetical protein
MNRRDWQAACIVAALTAGIVIAAGIPVATWAIGQLGQTGPVVTGVPALPPAELNIPSLAAKVKATTSPQVGQPVRVRLDLTSTAEKSGAEVPVTVTVLSTTMSEMSRVMPRPEQLAQATTTLVIGADGTASGTVELPLTWVAPPVAAPPATQPGNRAAARTTRTVTTHRLVLSSPLVGGPTATLALPVRAVARQQQP